VEDIILPQRQESKPVRVLKPVTVSPYKARRIDPDVVAFNFYDSFNYSILTSEHKDVRLTLGITSANPGEGKTLVASNLAVSLALAHEKRTILVDLNVRRPCIDKVFGTPQGPGLVEALRGEDITVWPTQVEHLSVLPAGGGGAHAGSRKDSQQFKRPNGHQSVRLNQLAEFRDILYSLEQEFEFIVVDIPAINGREFPILYAGQLEGLLVVLDATRTKKKDLEKMFRVVNEKQVLGFVFNRVRDAE
jgi:Mrp family chromosome partitioning ATPase